MDTLLRSDTAACLTVTDISSANGHTFVLDGPRSSVVEIVEGEVVGSFGREGNGPGEISLPSSVCALPSSCILISDFSGVHSYDRSGAWLGNIVDYFNNPMLDIHALDGSTFIAYKHNIYLANERTILDWSLSSYDQSGSRLTVFLSDTLSIERLSATEIINQSLFSFKSACGDGRVFLFDRNEAQYRVTCCDSAGQLLYAIEQDADQIEKTEGELASEAEAVNSWLTGLGDSDVMEYDYEPRAWREPVKDMWVTEDGTQLWVQRGDLDGFQFDIYSAVDGSLLETAEAQLDTTGLWQVDFFVADSSRVYAILETRDFEQLLVQFSSSS
jgi:hypothetical protein